MRGCWIHLQFISEVNGCYKLVNHNLEWSAAGRKCRSLHKDAHLLVINDAGEQAAVAEMLSSTNGKYRCMWFLLMTVNCRLIFDIT